MPRPWEWGLFFSVTSTINITTFSFKKDFFQLSPTYYSLYQITSHHLTSPHSACLPVSQLTHRAVSKTQFIWSKAIPNKLPGFPQDLPPTLFHPASPKMKPTKPAKEVDTASIASTSTFSSTVSLLKTKAKRTLPISYKDHRARKDAEEAAASSTVYSEVEKKNSKKSLPKDPKTRKWLPSLDPAGERWIVALVWMKLMIDIARQRTAEAYMFIAANK